MASNAAFPSVCTMRVLLHSSPDYRSLAICLQNSSNTNILRSSDSIVCRASCNVSNPRSGPPRSSRGNRHHFLELEPKNAEPGSRFGLGFSCGVDSASCCSSSRMWNFAPAAFVVGRGASWETFKTKISGTLSLDVDPSSKSEFITSSETKLSRTLMFSTGCNFIKRSSTGKGRTRRHRRKWFSEGVYKSRQSYYVVAEATHEGRDELLVDIEGSTEGHILAQTLVETSGRTKHRGLRPVSWAVHFTRQVQHNRSLRHICCCSADDHREAKLVGALSEEKNVDNLGVQMALALLRFYKKEISPYIPASCRYVPTCSEYAQQAYKKYGFVKGSVLTACRLARCNPLGASGFDPPRWFGEEKPPQV